MENRKENSIITLVTLKWEAEDERGAPACAVFINTHPRFTLSLLPCH